MSASLRDRMFIVLVCVLCYANFTGGTFHYDDFHSLLDNPHIRALANVPDFFADPTTFSADAEKKMYRPVLLVSYAVQYALHGYEPLGFLLGNLLLHIIASLLVGALAEVIVGDRRAGLVSALFFAAHPLAGEPVNYISSRSESLAACCYLATLLLALRGRRAGALVCYGVGLLVKSVVLTAPALLWTYDRWVREQRRDWRYYGAYGLLALGYLFLISYNRFLGGSLAVPVRDWTTQLLTQSKALVYYLQLVAMPTRLNVEHQFFEARAYGDLAVVAAVSLLASLAWLLWRGRGRLPGLALCWSGIVLLPTTIMPLNMLVNERRLYLVLACLALGWGYLSHRFAWRWQWVWLLCAIGLCLQRTPIWQSELQLWQDAVAKAPDMYRAQANLGKALQLAGRADEALAVYLQATALDNRQVDTYNNIATLYHLRGDIDEAISWYLQALERNPQMEEVHQNLGDAYAQKGATDLAIAAYERALAIDASKGEIWSNYGLILYETGDLTSAATAYQRALALLPEQAEPYNNLANIYVDRGDYKQAESMYKEALQRNPDGADQVLANLGDLYRSLARFNEGRERLQAAILHAPEQANWHYRLGRLEREAGRVVAAQIAFSRAIALAPSHVRARVERAELLAEAGDWQQAINEYRQALESRRDYARAWYGLGGALDELGDVAGALTAYRGFLSGWRQEDQRASEIRDRVRELQEGADAN